MNRWSIVLIFLTVGIFFWPVWVRGKLPIPADALVGLYHPYRDFFANRFPQGVPYKNFILTDPVLQQYPWKYLGVEQIRRVLGGESSKESPYKNPYSFGGDAASSVENIQAGAFYPLNVVFFLINKFSSAWTVFIIIQPILAAIFMFWWLRNKGISNLSSIFGGLVWAFSSFNLVWLEWGNIGHAGLYLPLALLAADKLKVKSDLPAGEAGKLKVRLKWHAIFQFALVFSLLAGHWQVTLYLLVVVTLYILFVKRFNPAAAGLNLIKFSIHFFLFLIITSFQWLPAWRFIKESNRAVEQRNVLTREGFFINPKQLVGLIAPDFFGNPATGNYRGEWNYAEQVIYIGIVPLVLALISVFARHPDLERSEREGSRRDSSAFGLRMTVGGWALTLVAIGLVLAIRNPIAEIPYRLNIPVWSDLQPTRLSYLITFGLAVLAVLGLENIIQYRFTISLDSLRSLGMTVLGGFGVVFLSLLVISSKFDTAERLVSQRNLVLPMTIWAVIGVFYTLPFFIKRFNLAAARLNLMNFIGGGLFLITVVDLFRFGWKFTPFSPLEYLYPVTPAIRFLKENLGEGEKYMTLDRRILPPNANIMYKISSIEGYDPIYSKEYAKLITEMETGNLQVEPASPELQRGEPANFGRIVRPGNFRSPIAKQLGVKFILSLSDITDPNLVKVFQEGETRIYENTKR